ncbi:hypothetical protein [Arundinibacter roseus]|uniref:Uncharacterized protein n=1 Tax=Arundinibacter roseus TaxID=2070510 RepID=A0A4V6P8N2_9BACT|nr:hypothetical protein [Arundinibacter roseus]TDB65205.1 hypothetical protein EZE20_10890 [Arundinibacter roseus]
METMKTIKNMHFEHMLWQNQLEFNRRELAIFERFLTQREEKILPHKRAELVGELHHFVRLVNNLLAEISSNEKLMCMEVRAEPVPKNELKEDFKYLREEMFYYDQNYRQFKKDFRSFAAALEIT